MDIKNKKNDLPINRQIKSRKVRLIDETGKALGIIDIDKALELANKASLDLVEIASNSDPVVCKILNYKKKLIRKNVWGI